MKFNYQLTFEIFTEEPLTYRGMAACARKGKEGIEAALRVHSRVFNPWIGWEATGGSIEIVPGPDVGRLEPDPDPPAEEESA